MALRIDGAIDMHCHYGPDFTARSAEAGHNHAVTGLQAAQEAAASGHRAIVLKSHSLASSTLAYALDQATPDLRVFGGTCTDYPCGGLNPETVDTALRLGGKIVWLPTVHSHQDWLNGKGERVGTRGEGLKVIGDDGEPTPEVKEIAALVRERGAVLATGHTTAAEHYAIARAFGKECRTLATHAGEHLAGPHLSAQQCCELADLGMTIELTALTCDHVLGQQGKDPREMIEMMHHIGCDRCVLATDYGWTTAVPHPAAGLQGFMETLWSLGVSEAELTTMAAHNPARMLGL